MDLRRAKPHVMNASYREQVLAFADGQWRSARGVKGRA
jgi:hypothetical protein